MRKMKIAFLAAAVTLAAFGAYMMIANYGVRAESPGPHSQSSFKAEIAGRVSASQLEVAPGDVQPMVALPKVDNFEGAWPGDWQLYGTPTWDRVSCNSHSPTRSVSGDGDPTCTQYQNNVQSSMIYGPFDLSGATAAGADYWFDLDTESDYDWLWALGSSDGYNFCGWRLSGSSAGWRNDYPLDFADPGCPNLLGQPQVWFAFIFESDGSITDRGAWVDDVNIWCVGCDGGGAPPNDDFDDAVPIPSTPYSNSQSTAGATAEPGEPDGCGIADTTVWYKFAASTTQPLIADTFGSDYDTILNVYSGPASATFADLALVDCNDDSGGLQSEVPFTATAGTTYYFQIDGFGAATGNLVFNLQEEEPGCWTGGPPAAAAADVAAQEPSSEEDGGIAVREGTPASPTDEAVPGELIIKFSPGVLKTERGSVVREEGAVLLRHLLVPGYALVGVPKGQEEEFLARLEANPKIELAERNGIKRVTFVPNDPYYPYQWHLPQIQMEEAWDVANGSGVVVAVIDTGVAYENYGGFAQAPDLAGTSFTGGCDFLNRDYHPNDDHGHGTHVAGTVAQTTNNGLGVAGVAYGSTVMPIKVCDDAGSCPTADIADGIMWATDYGADIINLSLGGSYASAEETAINYALSSGVVVVAASGNENASSLSCPACYPGVIAVGATDYNRDRAPYSNYGCDPEGSGHCLDVVAPGGDVTADENNDGYDDGVLQQTFEFACLGGSPDFTTFVYCFFQGTSMAAPHVAGAAALLLDANPSLTVQQVGDCLRNTALDRGAPGYDTVYGHGLIQVRDALDACAGQQNVTVRIGSGAAPTCSVDTVPLEVVTLPFSPPQLVGAATVDIVYDPLVVEPTAWAAGPAWDTVLCSLGYGPDKVRCTAIDAEGVTGEVLLADLTFHCIGEMGQSSPLDVQVATLTDPNGNPLPWEDEDGTFSCGLCGDVNCDGVIDAVDALFILQHVVGMRACSDQCPPPAGTLYCPGANVNGDTVIDAVDALFVLQCVVGMRPCDFVCSGL